MKNFKLIILFLGLSLGGSVWAMDVDIGTHLNDPVENSANHEFDEDRDTSRDLANQDNTKTLGNVGVTPDDSDYGTDSENQLDPANIQGSGGDGNSFGATGTEDAGISLDDDNASVMRGLKRTADNNGNSFVDSQYVVTNPAEENEPVDQGDNFENRGVDHSNDDLLVNALSPGEFNESDLDYSHNDEDPSYGPVNSEDYNENQGGYGVVTPFNNEDGYGVVTPFNNEDGYQEVQVSPKERTHVKLDEGLYGYLNPENSDSQEELQASTTKGGTQSRDRIAESVLNKVDEGLIKNSRELNKALDRENLSTDQLNAVRIKLREDLSQKQGEKLKEGDRQRKLKADKESVLARQRVNTNETEPEELQSGYQKIEPDYSEDLDNDNEDDFQNTAIRKGSTVHEVGDGFDDDLGTFFREKSDDQEELWDKKTGEWLSKKDYNIRNNPDFNDRIENLVRTGVVDRAGAIEEFKKLKAENLSEDQRSRLNEMANEYDEYLGNRKAKSLFGRKYQSINDDADTNNSFGKKHVKYREDGSLDGRRRYSSAQSGGRKTSNVKARSQIKNMFGIQ